MGIILPYDGHFPRVFQNDFSIEMDADNKCRNKAYLHHLSTFPSVLLDKMPIIINKY